MYLIYTAAFLYLSINSLVYLFILRLYKQMKIDDKNTTKEQKQFYHPILRKDVYAPRSKLKLFLLVFIFFIPRFLGLLLALTFHCLSVILINYHKNQKKEQSRFQIYLTRFVTIINARIMCFFLGIIFTKTKSLNKKLDNGPYLIMSNHISFLDSFYYSYFYQCAFVAKAILKKYPLIGQILENTQALFVERTNKESKDKILEQIGDRAQNTIFPLMIFPEATTGNGQQLLRLKKGVFVNETNLLVSILRYDSEWDPILDGYGQLVTLIAQLCHGRVDVYHTQWWVQGKKGEGWENFRDRVLAQIKENNDLEENRDVGFEEVHEFQKVVKAQWGKNKIQDKFD